MILFCNTVPYFLKGCPLRKYIWDLFFSTPYSNVISDNSMSRLILTCTKEISDNFHILIQKLEKLIIERKFLKGEVFATQVFL